MLRILFLPPNSSRKKAKMGISSPEFCIFERKISDRKNFDTLNFRRKQNLSNALVPRLLVSVFCHSCHDSVCILCDVRTRNNEPLKQKNNNSTTSNLS